MNLMVPCQSISPFILFIKPIPHGHPSVMLFTGTLNFQPDQFVFPALGWAWLLGFTGDVPPWGRSVQQGFMMIILRQTLRPSAKHTAFRLSMLRFASLKPLTSPNLSLSSLGLQACLLLHKEHWVHYTERSCPPTTARSSPPTSLLFPDLFPSHQSGLPCLRHASRSSFYFLRKPT